MPPIYGNVWYQILLRTLPTNTRFPWAQRLDPTNIECTYPQCHHPESYRHVLFECHHVAPIWSPHLQVWNHFGVHTTWDIILHPESFTVLPTYRTHKTRLRRLWICLTGALLHTLWHSRLATRYDHKPPPHTPSTTSGVIDLWSTNIRSWLRQLPLPKRSKVLETLSLLSQHPFYQDHWAHRPFSLRLSM